jgi:hypothetical protein
MVWVIDVTGVSDSQHALTWRGIKSEGAGTLDPCRQSVDRSVSHNTYVPYDDKMISKILSKQIPIIMHPKIGLS